MPTLRFPKSEPAPEARPDQVVVAGYALALEPAGDDQQQLTGELSLFRPTTGADAAWVQLVFRGDDGALLGAVTLHTDTPEPHVTLEVDELVRLSGEVHRISLQTAAEHRRPVRLPQGNGTTSVLAARAWVGEPDEADGAQWVRAVIELDHTGLPVERVLLHAHLALEGGGREVLPLPLERGLGRGHQVLTAGDWFLAADRPALSASLQLSCCERVWKGGPTVDAAGTITGPPRARELPALPEQTAPVAPADASAWELVDKGFAEAALAAFAGTGLDSAGRDRLRGMLRSPDPEALAQGADIAAATGHKSAVSQLRRLLTHDAPLVRAAAARAVGSLGGPSLAVPVRKLLDDPDAEVKQAAAEALALLDR